MQSPQLTALYLAARMSSLTMPANYKGCTERFVVMTPESVIIDLVYCLENTTAKWVKRMERITFLIKFFGHTISPETVGRINRLIVKIKSETPKNDEETNQSLETLIAEMPKHTDDSIIINKRDPSGEYKPPMKQFFNNACKKVVNEDGIVYNVFAAIAAISYKEMLALPNQSVLREHLFRSSKLVFKGGAAVGKFLFQSNTELWNSMLKSDRQFVLDNFINGGDNDTGITFAKTAALDWFSTEEINNEIGSAVYDFQMLLLENVRRYNVEQIIDKYLNKVNGMMVTFDGEEFVAESRKSISFGITEKNNQQDEILFIDGTPETLFGSISYLEFPNESGNMIKFHLARIKAGYKFTMNNITVNCYAECLDVSANLIDSAMGGESEYQPIDIFSITTF